MFDESMGFSTYNDFFKRRNNIKKQYMQMNCQEKRIYKMYLYSQRDMSTPKVDLIWEFLNESDTSIYCPSKEKLKMYFVDALEKDDSEYIVEDDEFEY